MSILSIGIDPGKTTGFAIYNRPLKSLVVVRDTDFWGVFDLLSAIPQRDVHIVVVEVPSTKHVWQKEASSKGAMQRQAVNVGSVIREAELLANGIELLGYKVKRVDPRGKVPSARFVAHTGWTRRTNQHQRDAALMCFGR